MGQDFIFVRWIKETHTEKTAQQQQQGRRGRENGGGSPWVGHDGFSAAAAGRRLGGPPRHPCQRQELLRRRPLVPRGSGPVLPSHLSSRISPTPDRSPSLSTFLDDRGIRKGEAVEEVRHRRWLDGPRALRRCRIQGLRPQRRDKAVRLLLSPGRVSRFSFILFCSGFVFFPGPFFVRRLRLSFGFASPHWDALDLIANSLHVLGYCYFIGWIRPRKMEWIHMLISSFPYLISCFQLLFKFSGMDEHIDWMELQGS